MSFIDCRGSACFYRLFGRGATPGEAAAKPALVFVNALGTDTHIWDPLIAALPKRVTSLCPLLSYDQRGQGLSELGDAPHTVAALAADLDALLAQLGLGASVVCGLSLGGLVAQELAAKFPERVRALCLLATGLNIGAPELWSERIALVQERGLPALAPSVMERWFTPAFRERNPVEVAGYRTLFERNAPRGYIAALEALRAADLSQQTTALRVPTLVLAGEADTATPPPRVRELTRALPHARWALVPRAGHLLPVEQPGLVAQAITTFLEEFGVV
jgi:3-oxoadipate enol-lactonase